MKKNRSILLLGTLLLSSTLLASCSNDDEAAEEFVFEFSGSGTIEGTKYDFEVKGVEADNEFYIKTLNTEFEEIWGEWTFTEGKGYILTFDDAYWTEKKVKYDTDNKQFYFTYEVNLGSAVGKTKVKFTGDASTFNYDGEGWGFEPFEFSASGLDVFGMTTVDITLTCYEDLTFKTQASCPLIAVPERNGTYSFSETDNAYTFIFSDEANPSVTTYDSETGAYNLTLTLNVGMPLPFTISYIPE